MIYSHSTNSEGITFIEFFALINGDLDSFLGSLHSHTVSRGLWPLPTNSRNRVVFMPITDLKTLTVSFHASYSEFLTPGGDSISYTLGYYGVFSYMEYLSPKFIFRFEDLDEAYRLWLL